MDTVTDPIDILNILVEDIKEELGDKYKTVINLLKEFRSITGGNTYYTRNIPLYSKAYHFRNTNGKPKIKLDYL